MFDPKPIRWTALLSILLMGTIPARAEEPQASPQEQARLIAELAPSLVRIEYALQFDNGESPYGSGWATRCPNCGRFHGEDTDNLISEERPAALGGFLVAPDLVVSSDFAMHPRFIRAIHVRAGNERLAARIHKYHPSHNAVTLKLEKPLSAAKPLAFAPDAAGPYQAVTYVEGNADWQINAKPMSLNVTALDSGRRFIPAPSRALIVSADGKPVTLSMNDEFPADESWKQSPLDWESIDDAAMDQLQSRIQRIADQNILHVKLSLRSPRPATSDPYRYRSRFRSDSDEATEKHALAVVTSPTTLLVLDMLKPAATARLERITVHLPDGSTASASFSGSLLDYGAFVATLDKPLEQAIVMSDQSILALRDRLLLAAEVKLQGETRVCHIVRRRIAQFNTGWRQQIYPGFAGTDNSLFLFDPSGKLVSLPVLRRDRTSDEDDYSRPEPLQTAVTYIAGVMNDLPSHLDPANVPLTEDEESRIAWLGIEMQALTPELARANNVSDLTNDGSTGVLVTYVYPGSPAQQAGIDVGTVLLRIHTEDRPKPIDISADGYAFSDQPFPWDRYDSLTEPYFDQIPQPWPSAETKLARSLTDLGFGKSFELEYAANGAAQRKQFTVVQSPAHYDTAPRVKSDVLGLTVRDMTYEVRRYFQRGDDEPGVIVSRIEPGSKASLAGLKPHEFITHINDRPVNGAADFEQLVKGGGELQLSVRRMTRGRVVKISLDAAPTTPAEEAIAPAAE